MVRYNVHMEVMPAQEKKLVSIVIPCYNEEKNIDRTFDGLLEVAKNPKYNYEIIAVNDGSKDGTWGVIESYAKRNELIKGINLMRNHGMGQAYNAGFDHAKGDYIVIVSADLEIPLENIHKVVGHLDNGYDFVNTNRRGRWNETGRKIGTSGANYIISKISRVKMNDNGSGMKGFTRQLADNLRFYGETHRFIAALASVYTENIIEFDVDFKDRDYGSSAYGSGKRTLKVMLDLVTLTFLLYFARKPFWTMPGRIFGFAGAVMAGLGGLGSFYLFVLKLIGESIGNRPLFTVSILLVVLGIQSMMLGMLGELMVRIYFESSGRRDYTIREVVD
jgi:glycosyltransferase involved in cell wall biosynthesis